MVEGLELEDQNWRTRIRGLELEQPELEELELALEVSIGG